MHNFPPSPEKPLVRLPLPFRARRRAGFSLIEVALAITIVAFAFVALLGLLPTGMNVFNQTIDSTNEMRISSDMTSMLQATEYDKIAKLDPAIADNIFYFDSDGGALDSETVPIARYIPSRVYAARLVIDKQNIPALKGVDFFDQKLVALRVMVVIGKSTPTNVSLLTALHTSADVQDLPVKQKLRVLPILITKTDGQ
jgi:uncharacterized protein (TIGR02598 family)